LCVFLSTHTAPSQLYTLSLHDALPIFPPPKSSKRALEMGAYMHMTPALQCVLGYQEVRGAYFGPLGRSDEKCVTVGGREVFHCLDRKSTRLNSSHVSISYAVFCLKKKK